MAVGRYCITAVHRLYSCISGVSDWHAGDHRICGKRFCSRADYGLRVCCLLIALIRRKEKTFRAEYVCTRKREGGLINDRDLIAGFILLPVGLAAVYLIKEKRRGAGCIKC